MKIGILIHVYHLGAQDWKGLIWGDPATDRLGTMPTFAELLLRIPKGDTLQSIIYSGPSSQDGLTEGAYARQYLLDHYEQLPVFSRLSHIQELTPSARSVFDKRIHGLLAGPVIKNTEDELTEAAIYLSDCDMVYYIAAASHAPRCLQIQLRLRALGTIRASQPWYLVPSETCFAGTTMYDLVIVEPPHRGDDPMLLFKPQLAEAIRPYFTMTPEAKQQFIRSIATHTKS